ncbi:MAG: alpha-isopropylmalate synthase regulatory domain-containing protein, partial [Oscillospiraceae bacterium]
HIDPYLVGNRRKFPTSEISGHTVILERIKEILPNIQVDEAKSLLTELKRLECDGYQFEGADASFELLVRKQCGKFTPLFSLINYRIYTGVDKWDGYTASATVKVQVGDTVQLMAAEGNGPVNALDTALRKALEVFYPSLDSKDATAAVVRVLITSSDGKDTFTTVGVSGDVVDASWKALNDSLEYILLKKSSEIN